MIDEQKGPVISFGITIPVEVDLWRWIRNRDLNNIFVTDENPMQYLEKAERDGFPKSMQLDSGIYELSPSLLRPS